MRPLFAAALLAVALGAQAGPGLHYAGGDGSSAAEAVVILDAAGEEQGVQAEYAWLDSHFPGFHDLQQSLLNQDGKVYDLLRFTLPDGSRHVVYFDISAFFGKD